MPSLPTRPDLFRGRAFALAALTAFAGPALGAAQRTFVASYGSDVGPPPYWWVACPLRHELHDRLREPGAGAVGCVTYNSPGKIIAQ